MSTRITNHGFTLVELMISVAVVGILASIAIPTYQKSIEKARQSEAKVNLGGLYVAEQNFHNEYSTYYGGEDSIGFGIVGTLHYDIGFIDIGVRPPNAPPTSAPPFQCGDACETLVTTPPCLEAITWTCDMLAGTGRPFADDQVIPVNPTNAATFTALASGYLYAGSSVVDIWTIDQDNNLVNVQDGL